MRTGLSCIIACGVLLGVSGCVGEAEAPQGMVRLDVTSAGWLVPIGRTLKMQAQTFDSAGSPLTMTSDIIWSSSDETIATVSNESQTRGVVTGRKVGTAIITGTWGLLHGEVTLSIGPAELDRIAVSPSPMHLGLGESQTFTATGTWSDGSSKDITSDATWSVSQSGVLGGASTNHFTALMRGSTDVTATLSGKSGTSVVSVGDPALVSVEIEPEAASIALGTNQMFQVTGLYTDGTRRDVTARASFNVANGNVADLTVMTGQAAGKGIGVGSTQIVATLDGRHAAAQLTVTDAELVSLVVNPTETVIARGESANLELTGLYTDGSRQRHTLDATWLSVDQTVATFPDTGGRVRGVGVGITNVVASYHGKTVQAEVTVSTAALVTLTLSVLHADLPRTTSLQLAVTGTYTDGTVSDLTDQSVWISSSPAVASVTSTGMVTGLTVGSSAVSATFQGRTPTAQITVTPAPLVSIAVSPQLISLPRGLTRQVTATGTYADGTVIDISNLAVWTSSDPMVASVSNAAGTSGLVSAHAVGSSTITASVGMVSRTTQVEVTAAVLNSLVITPSLLDLPLGVVQPLTLTGVYTDGATEDLTRYATWTTVNPAVLEVSTATGTEGVLTARALGTTIVRGSFGGQQSELQVSVSAAALRSIGVTPASPSLARGTRVQLAATGVYSDNSVRDLTSQVAWAAAQPAVAFVSNLGELQALDIGQSAVTAQLSGVTGQTSLTVTPAVLSSIEVSPASATLARGTQTRLSATGVYSDGSRQDLTAFATWSVDNGNASVETSGSARGRITALQLGHAVVSASLSSVTGSAQVDVTAAVLDTLMVGPTSASAAQGTTRQFTAIGIYSDQTAQDVTAQASWVSSVTSVATISVSAGSQGLATAVSAGVTQVTATFGGKVASTSFTVVTGNLTSISVLPNNSSAAKGTTRQFIALGNYSDGSSQDITQQVAWSSSAPAIATVSNAAGSRGLATTVAMGNVTIFASLGGTTGSAGFTVTAPSLSFITVAPGNLSLMVGATAQLTATGHYSDGSTQDLTASASFTSIDPNVAQVSSTGLVTAIASGSTNVMAIAQGQNGSVSVTVSN